MTNRTRLDLVGRAEHFAAREAEPTLFDEARGSDTTLALVSIHSIVKGAYWSVPKRERRVCYAMHAMLGVDPPVRRALPRAELRGAPCTEPRPETSSCGEEHP